MKKLLIIILLASATRVSAQPATTTLPVVETDYLKLSRTQKIAALTLLGGGTVLAIAGISVALQDVFLFSFDKSGNHYQTGTILFTIGGASILGSVPLFIASAGNKRKAQAISAGIKMETRPDLQQTTWTKRSYPALTLTFNLK